MSRSLPTPDAVGRGRPCRPGVTRPPPTTILRGPDSEAVVVAVPGVVVGVVARTLDEHGPSRLGLVELVEAEEVLGVGAVGVVEGADAGLVVAEGTDVVLVGPGVVAVAPARCGGSERRPLLLAAGAGAGLGRLVAEERGVDGVELTGGRIGPVGQLGSARIVRGGERESQHGLGGAGRWASGPVAGTGVVGTPTTHDVVALEGLLGLVGTDDPYPLGVGWRLPIGRSSTRCGFVVGHR